MSARIKIEDGRTYIDVSTSNSSDTIRYGTQTYSPVSGTVTLAVDKDGSNFAITGLEKGDKFKLGNITYTMSSARLMATNEGGTTTHFLNQRVVAGTGEILVSSLSLLPENLGNTKYYTCLNPGLVSLLTDSTAATQYTGTNYSTTGVAIGVSNTAITMGVPSKLSANNITQIFLDITPPTTSSAVLNVHFPYNTASFFFKLTVTNSGTLQVDAYTDSTLLATTGTINLANYEVNMNAPIRLGLQTNFDDDTTGNKTYVNLVVGSYVYNQQLETNILFNETNRLFSFVSDSGNEVKISNIIVRDEQISSLAERIVALPVSVTDTDMTENNGLYTATTADQTLLQTPDVSSLIATYGEASPVTNVLVVGNPAYRTGDGITTLTSIDKTGNTITDHNTITLGTNTLAAASDCWALSNITLNDFANMQFGWKTGASS